MDFSNIREEYAEFASSLVEELSIDPSLVPFFIYMYGKFYYAFSLMVGSNAYKEGGEEGVKFLASVASKVIDVKGFDFASFYFEHSLPDFLEKLKDISDGSDMAMAEIIGYH